MMIIILQLTLIICAFMVGVTVTALIDSVSPTVDWPPSLPDRLMTLADWGITPRRFTPRVPERLRAYLADWPLESPEFFAAWWRGSVETERAYAYVGRHRYGNADWRTHWAKWDTQWWPTLSTSGHAWNLVTDDCPTLDEWEILLKRSDELAMIT